MIRLGRAGQSIVEYGLVLAFFAAALAAMQGYASRKVSLMIDGFQKEAFDTPEDATAGNESPLHGTTH